MKAIRWAGATSPKKKSASNYCSPQIPININCEQNNWALCSANETKHSFWVLRPPEREQWIETQTKRKQGTVVNYTFVCVFVCTTFSRSCSLPAYLAPTHKYTLENSWAYWDSVVSWCRSALFSFCIGVWEGLQSSDYHCDPRREQPLLGQTGSEGTGAVGWPSEIPPSPLKPHRGDNNALCWMWTKVSVLQSCPLK